MSEKEDLVPLLQIERELNLLGSNRTRSGNAKRAWLSREQQDLLAGVSASAAGTYAVFALGVDETSDGVTSDTLAICDCE